MFNVNAFRSKLSAWFCSTATCVLLLTNNFNCAPQANHSASKRGSVCKQLETGRLDVDAIGFYGGKDGTRYFLVVTEDGHVWDHVSYAFDLYEHKVTLQEWSVTKVDFKWPNLRNHYRPSEKRMGGAVMRVQDQDWLVFMLADGMLLNQSLTDPSKPVIFPKIMLEEMEDYKLVSSVPAKSLHAVGKSLFNKLCLSQMSINVEAPSWWWPYSQTRLVASK